ncbi:MAG TPA: wax ester/triacylglycerol synthase family O-acyltransferase [Sporichthyaceae bacterium]|jgi:WS/DGAT/MGAT family acyltransferase
MQDWALSPLDISFLTIETAATPMNMGAVLVIGGEAGATPDPERMLALLRERTVTVPRLRRKLGSDRLPFGGASWVEDPDFDIHRHVQRTPARGQGGRAELNAWIARTLADPLDRRRPLWELHLLTGLADGSVALMMKMHHAFLDGLGAVALAYALSDGGSPDRLPGPPATEGTKAAARSVARRLVGPLADVTQPRTLARTALHAAGTAAGVVSTMSRPGHGLPFDRTVSPSREFVSASVPLADLRLVRKLHGGPGSSANDVLVALMAGALRTWLTDLRLDTDRTIRAMVPVGSSRPPVTGGAANNFSAFLVELPVNEPDPVARVRSVCEAMTHNRAIGPEGGPGAVQLLTNLLPPALVRLGGPMMATRAARLFDVLVTTVPLPRPMAVDGFPCVELYPVAPLAQGQPLGIALSTYRGHGYIGISADPVAVPDAAALAAAVPAELERLLALS